MAGTLTISTLSDGTNSTSSTNCIQGSAKGWVKFNSSGTILSSYNVSSVTKNTTGAFYITWTNAFADANYSVVSSSSKTTGNYNDTTGYLCYSGCPAQTTTIAYISNWVPGAPYLQDFAGGLYVAAFSS
jgi:hypothetical protein